MAKQIKRTTETKQALMDAFWELFCERKIEKITVKAITEKAGFNRSTFYEYFRDVYDVLEAIEDDILQEHKNAMVRNLLETDAETAKKNTILFLEKNITRIAILLGPNGDPKFHIIVKKHIASFLQDYMDIDKDDVDVQLTIALFSGAVISLIQFWYQHQEELTLQEILAAAINFSKNGVLPFLEKFNFTFSN